MNKLWASEDSSFSSYFFCIVSILLFIAVIVGCRNQPDRNSKRGDDKPNIVYIFADDLGYNEVGAYGQKKIETPNIDALAQNGMRFTQHYAFPVCAPSRFLLLTGKNSGHAYIRGNDGWNAHGSSYDYQEMAENPTRIGQWPMRASTTTSAKLLKNTGYKTGLVGKWGLGDPMSTGLPNKQGFDFFYGYIGQKMAHNYYPPFLWENNGREALNNKVMDAHQKLPDGLDPLDPKNYEKYDQSDYAPKLMLDEVIGFIESNKDGPFFLEYAPNLPHVSLQAPKKWVNYYHKKFGDEEPYTGRGESFPYLPARYPRATYAAMVSYLDEQVGKIIKKLKAIGEYENTLIMFSSDNGPTWNGGTESPWFDSAAPFKSEQGWGKASLHEGGIRVPMIAEWKGKIKPGSTTKLISATWDVFPTLCDLVGIKQPDDIQGISFLPTLLGDSTAQKKHDHLYWEFRGRQAVRLGKWKAMRNTNNMRIKLYNLKEDIQEQNDVAEQNPEIVAKIKQIMKKEHTTPAVEEFRIEALEKKEE